MRRTLRRLAIKSSVACPSTAVSPPLVHISNGTFYRQHPSTTTKTEDYNKTDNGTSVNENPPLFPNLNFTVPSFSHPNEHWCVLSNSSAVRTTFLKVLRGQLLCFPPTARSYPYLATDAIAGNDLKLRSPSHAIGYVGFDAERGNPGVGGMRGAYLSARYESRKEETDFSLNDFLLGHTKLNADETVARLPDLALMKQIVADLKLDPLMSMPVTHLSNGQMRRARIAKALLAKPELLLLDGPFMGLDPPTLDLLASLLHRLAEARAPRIILSLKPDEHIPSWITHMVFISKQFEVDSIGTRELVTQGIQDRFKQVTASMRSWNVEGKKGRANRPIITDAEIEIVGIARHLQNQISSNRPNTISRAAVQGTVERGLGNQPEADAAAESIQVEKAVSIDDMENTNQTTSMSPDGSLGACVPDGPPGEALMEMKGVKVQYGQKVVLGNWKQKGDEVEKDGLWWTISRGQRWGVFGPNGSGKTTLISLMTSDHPQTYSLPILLFGKSRLPEPGKPGISIFDIQARIGHSSPEVHTFFPKNLTVRRTIETAWSDTPLTKPRLQFKDDEKVSAALRWFQAELHPSLGPTRLQQEEMRRHGMWEKLFVTNRALFERSRTAGSVRVAHLKQDLDLESQSLSWADELHFGELSFAAQRVALFIRAIIRNPDVVILDEAFSGMDDFARDRCHLFLAKGETETFKWRKVRGTRKVRPDGPQPMQSDIFRLGRTKIGGLTKEQALVVVSHKREEIPDCIRDWICLPESGDGAPPRVGRFTASPKVDIAEWYKVWGQELSPLEAKVRTQALPIRSKKTRRRPKTDSYEPKGPTKRREKVLSTEESPEKGENRLIASTKTEESLEADHVEPKEPAKSEVKVLSNVKTPEERQKEREKSLIGLTETKKRRKDPDAPKLSPIWKRESAEQREKRLAKKKAYQRSRKARIEAEAEKKRLKQNAAARQRAATRVESPEEKEKRLARYRAAGRIRKARREAEAKEKTEKKRRARNAYMREWMASNRKCLKDEEERAASKKAHAKLERLKKIELLRSRGETAGEKVSHAEMDGERSGSSSEGEMACEQQSMPTEMERWSE